MMLARLWRSTFGVVALVALGFAAATLVIGAIAYEVTHEALEEQLDHRVSVETRVLLDEAAGGGLPRVAEAIRLREAARSSSSLDYVLLDDAGRRVAGAAVPSSHLAAGYEEFFRFRRGSYSGVGQALATRVVGGLLVVIADRHDLKEIDRTLGGLFAASLAATLALGTGAAALIALLTSRRLARVDRTALAIIGGDLSRRVPRDGSGSEFDRLAETLNRMLDRIGALMDNLRQVSSDVAHDLRTPLTRLHGQLERAGGAADEEERALAIDAARAQAGELLEIFAALLRIAEVEGLAERRALTAVDLSGLIEEMAETYWPDLERGGRTLTTQVAPGLVIRGDRRLLAQAVSNLLENVIRHTPAGSRARLSVRDAQGRAELVVADDGPGVDAADRDRLFSRFARGEAARTTPGHGLGLALVRAVAAAHGGEASLSTDEEGFAVALRLPLSVAPWKDDREA